MVLLYEIVFVLEVSRELVDRAVKQLLHRVIRLHHQRLQLSAHHRLALTVTALIHRLALHYMAALRCELHGFFFGPLLLDSRIFSGVMVFGLVFA